MTDSSGNVVSQYGYDPYGRQTKISGTGPDADFGYAGMYVHQRSGLNLTPHRAYNPAIGKFISRDPIEETGGINLYAYVENNPIQYADPSGLDGKDPKFPDCIKNHDQCEKWCYSQPGTTSDWRIDCLLQCDKKFPQTSPVTNPTGPKPIPPTSGQGPGNSRTPVIIPIIIPTPIGTPIVPVPIIIPGSPVVPVVVTAPVLVPVPVP